MSDEDSPACPVLSAEERDLLAKALSRLANPEQADDAIEALSDLYLTPD